VYDNQTAEWSGLREHASRLRVRLLMVEDADRLTRAKFYYQDRFAALLRRMQRSGDVAAAGTPLPSYIWLVDSDISFERFRLDQFLQSWACSFASGPPLISQPAILENTQGFWHLNWQTWENVASYPMLAREASFVEMQLPLLDVGYFLHFDAGVARQILNLGLQVGSGWGYDLVWCQDAAKYLPSRVACAVIPTPISHQNTKTLHKDLYFMKHGEQVKHFVMHAFPDLFLFPHDLTNWNHNITLRNASKEKMLAPRPVPPSSRQCVVREGAALEPAGVLSGIHVYWINGDPTRQEYMVRQFAEMGITSHTRVPATMQEDVAMLLANGLEVRDMIVSKHVASNVRDSPRATPEQKRTYSFSELGCTMSHLRAVHMAFRAQHLVSLILEDDLDLSALRLSPYSLAELGALAPADWRVLQLQVNNVAEHKKWCNTSIAFWPWRKQHWSSAAYLLTRDGAATLASSISGPDEPGFAKSIAAFLSKFLHEDGARSPLVADNWIYHANEPYSYSYSRPFFGLAPAADTSIRTAEVLQLVHKPLQQYTSEYFQFSGLFHCASLSASSPSSLNCSSGCAMV